MTMPKLSLLLTTGLLTLAPQLSLVAIATTSLSSPSSPSSLNSPANPPRHLAQVIQVNTDEQAIMVVAQGRASIPADVVHIRLTFAMAETLPEKPAEIDLSPQAPSLQVPLSLPALPNSIPEPPMIPAPALDDFPTLPPPPASTFQLPANPVSPLRPIQMRSRQTEIQPVPIPPTPSGQVDAPPSKPVEQCNSSFPGFPAIPGLPRLPGSSPNCTPEAKPIPQQTLQPILNSLAQNGVTVEQVKIDTDSRLYRESARLTFELKDPSRDRLQKLFSDVEAAAKAGNLNLERQETRYTTNRCPELNRAVYRAALDNARSRATALAEAMEVRLGSVPSVSESAFSGALTLLFNAVSNNSFSYCDSANALVQSFDPKSLPELQFEAYDQQRPIEVQGYRELYVTFPIRRDR
jgi:hypothetical protein